jgi:hypothetical protein
LHQAIACSNELNRPLENGRFNCTPGGAFK